MLILVVVLFTILYYPMILVHAFPSSLSDGKGIETEKVQKYYFNETWNEVMAFVEDPNGKKTMHIVKLNNKCRGFFDAPYMYDVACVGPNPDKIPAPRSTSAWGVVIREVSRCPNGYSLERTIYETCCENEQMNAIGDARSQTCPDGSMAGGCWWGENFMADFSENCQDLICAENQACIQINKYFAKCCQKNVTISSMDPFLSGQYKRLIFN